MPDCMNKTSGLVLTDGNSGSWNGQRPAKAVDIESTGSSWRILKPCLVFAIRWKDFTRARASRWTMCSPLLHRPQALGVQRRLCHILTGSSGKSLSKPSLHRPGSPLSRRPSSHSPVVESCTKPAEVSADSLALWPLVLSEAQT